MQYLIFLLLAVPLLAAVLHLPSIMFFSSGLLVTVFYLSSCSEPCESLPMGDTSKSTLHRAICSQVNAFNDLVNKMNEAFKRPLRLVTRGYKTKSLFVHACSHLLLALIVGLWPTGLFVFTKGTFALYRSNGYMDSFIYTFSCAHYCFCVSVYLYLLFCQISEKQKPKHFTEAIISMVMVLATVAYFSQPFTINHEIVNGYGVNIGIRQLSESIISKFSAKHVFIFFLVNYVATCVLCRFFTPTFAKYLASKAQEKVSLVAAGWSSLLSTLSMFIVMTLWTVSVCNYLSEVYRPNYLPQYKSDSVPSADFDFSGLDGSFTHFDFDTFSFTKERFNDYTIDGAPEASAPLGLLHAYYESRKGAYNAALSFAYITTSVESSEFTLHIKRLNAIYDAVDQQLTQIKVPADTLPVAVQNSGHHLSLRYKAIKTWKANKPIDSVSMKLVSTGQYDAFWAHYLKHKDVIEMTTEDRIKKGIESDYWYSDVLARTLYKNGHKPSFEMSVQDEVGTELADLQKKLLPFYKYLDRIDERHNMAL